MGQGQSHNFSQSHITIWNKLLQIHDPVTRVKTMETVLTGDEYINSAKRAGLYSHCLAYISAVRQGRQPSKLPGEDVYSQKPSNQLVVTSQAQGYGQGQGYSQGYGQTNKQTQLQHHSKASNTPVQQVMNSKRSEKALSFFTACLRVLNIQEEVVLTESTLRAAYKKAAVRAHPDKGGSEEQFQAITKAYAYLNDILRLIQGQKGREGQETVPELSQVQETRTRQAADLSHVEPVRLNPKNLNMTVFNQMFEQTRVPDPDSDGYGDWLTTDESQAKANSLKSKQKFGKDFNREVFNRMFEDDQREKGYSTSLMVQQPQALVLNVNSGVELGRDRPPDYTAAANASLKYTDLKHAYTKDNIISSQISGVRPEERSYDSYKTTREKGPVMYSAQEQEELSFFERQQAQQEAERRKRMANEMLMADDFHERMKRLVITG
jgi:curved DNA-binding protein CbpA